MDLTAMAWKTLAEPSPDVDVLEVFFDTNRLIRETFGAAGYPTPMQPNTVTPGPAASRGRQ